MDQVSIIIPTYNRAKLLPYAINSILNQTYSNWECIIIDDGSLDNTYEVIQEYLKSDARISYVHQDNHGVSAARNRGIKLSKGDFIAFLDSDDRWEPEMLEKCVQCFPQYPGKDIIYCGWDIVDTHGSRISGPFYHHFNIEEDFFYENIIPIHAALIRKGKNLDLIFFDESLITHEDWDFWLRLKSNNFVFFGLNQLLAHYLKHNDCTTSNIKKMEISSDRIIAKNEIPEKIRHSVFIYRKLHYAFHYWQNKDNSNANEKINEINAFLKKLHEKLDYNPRYEKYLVDLPNCEYILDYFIKNNLGLTSLKLLILRIAKLFPNDSIYRTFFMQIYKKFFGIK